MQELQKAQQAIEGWESKESQLIEWCNKASVSNIDEQKKVQDLLTEVKQGEKRLLEKKDEMINPLQDVISKIRILFKPKEDQIAQIKKHLISLLNNWHKDQLSVTEEVVTKRAEEFWVQSKEAEKTGEIVPLPDLAVNPPPKTSHHNMGTTSYRQKIIVRIIKPDLIPRQFCMPTESLLKKHAEMEFDRSKQLPTVDGVVFEIEYIPVSRPVK